MAGAHGTGSRAIVPRHHSPHYFLIKFDVLLLAQHDKMASPGVLQQFLERSSARRRHRDIFLNYSYIILCLLYFIDKNYS
jgi:hypothetical protein